MTHTQRQPADSGNTSSDVGTLSSTADKYSWCYSCMNAIEEGQKVFQRDGASVCERCDPLYDLRRPAHAGGITSKRAR